MRLIIVKRNQNSKNLSKTDDTRVSKSVIIKCSELIDVQIPNIITGWYSRNYNRLLLLLISGLKEEKRERERRGERERAMDPRMYRNKFLCGSSFSALFEAATPTPGCIPHYRSTLIYTFTTTLPPLPWGLFMTRFV